MTVDVSKPIENPKLTALLRELRDADPSGKQALCEAIAREIALNASLLAVFQTRDGDIEDRGDGKAVFKKDTVLLFPFLTAPDGIQYLPVYTDWNALRACEAYRNAEVKTMILPFDQMAYYTECGKGIVVNPYSDNFIISPENVAQMKRRKEETEKGFSTQKITKQTTVRIGDPANDPTALKEAISRYAKQTKTIKSMWLKLMEREGEKSYLVIVDLDGDRNVAFKGIGDAAAPYLKNGMYLDMVPYHDDFGQRAATGEPFYRRKKGLFRR